MVITDFIFGIVTAFAAEFVVAFLAVLIVALANAVYNIRHKDEPKTN